MNHRQYRVVLSPIACLLAAFCLAETCTAEIVHTGTSARFVRVTNNGAVDRELHIGEIEAFLTTAFPAGSGMDNVNDVALGTKGASYESSVGTGGHGSTAAVYDGVLQTAGATWTRKTVGAEYVLDLGQTRDLATVRVWQRGGCCQDRLSDFTFSLLADNGAGSPGAVVYNENYPGQAPTTLYAKFDTVTSRLILPGSTGTIGVEVQGEAGARFIRVSNENGPRTLHIGEIEAFLTGVTPTPGTLDNANDMALASQGAGFESQVGNGGHGATSAVYNGAVETGGATWTRDNAGEYVLDLGQVRDLGIVRVWQRGDCCDVRLSDFTVTLLDDDGTGLPGGELYSVSYPGTAPRPGFAEFAIPYISGRFTIEDTDTLMIELDADAGTADLFSVDVDGSGGLTIESGATLDVSLLAGTLQSGDTFDILDFGSVTGTFTTVNLPGAILPAQYWDLSQLYTSGQITLGVPEPSALVLLALCGLGVFGYPPRRRRPGTRREQ